MDNQPPNTDEYSLLTIESPQIRPLAQQTYELQVKIDRHELQVERDRVAIASERFALQQEHERERGQLAAEWIKLAHQQEKAELAHQQARLGLTAERNRFEQAAQQQMAELTSLKQQLEAQLLGHIAPACITIGGSERVGTASASPSRVAPAYPPDREDDSATAISMEEIERQRAVLHVRGKELKALVKEVKAQQSQLASLQLAATRRVADMVAKERVLLAELAAAKTQETAAATQLQSQLDVAQASLEAADTKLDMILDVVPHVADCFRVITLLNLNEKAARAMLMREAYEFDDEYGSRLDFIQACKLNETQSRALLTMKKPTYLASDLIHDKITVCYSLGLVGDQADRVMALSPGNFRTDGVYTRFQERLRDAIAACKKNSLYYGKEDSMVALETKCPQLGLQGHCSAEHYIKLLDWLYPNGKSSHKKCSFGTNPHDPAVTFDSITIFADLWRPLYISREIPELTPDLKLFFSTPCIADGDWVQFHGPGTMLYDLDPTFDVYLGSLCDPEKKGSFTSLHTETEYDESLIEGLSPQNTQSPSSGNSKFNRPKESNTHIVYQLTVYSEGGGGSV